MTEKALPASPAVMALRSFLLTVDAFVNTILKARHYKKNLVITAGDLMQGFSHLNVQGGDKNIVIC